MTEANERTGPPALEGWPAHRERPLPDRIAIRPARPADFAKVGEITVRAYAQDGFLKASESYAATLRDAATRAEEAELWVAVDPASGRLLGSVTFCPSGSPYRELSTETEGEFRMLAVDPPARGFGVGRALVRHCLDRSRRLGFAGVVLCSLPTMTSAHALYRSLGFVRDETLDWSPVSGVELWGFRTGLLSG